MPPPLMSILSPLEWITKKHNATDSVAFWLIFSLCDKERTGQVGDRMIKKSKNIAAPKSPKKIWILVYDI